MKKLYVLTMLGFFLSLFSNDLLSQNFTVGPASPAIGSSSAYTSTNHYTIFSVLNPNGVFIDTVDIYPTATVGSSYSIVLQNSAASVITTYSGTTTVNSGPERVPINLFVPAGTGYRLGFTVIPAVLRNSTGANYPYTVSGIMSITGNTFNTAYYYFFYNMKIHVAPLKTYASISAIVSPSASACVGSQEVEVMLKNHGPSYLYNTQIDWKVNNVAQTSAMITDTIPVGDSAIVNIGTTNFNIGTTYRIDAKSVNPNGLTDSNLTNDSTFRAGITVNPNPQAVPLSLQSDICLGDTTEISMTLSGSPPWSVRVNNGPTNFNTTGITSSPFTFKYFTFISDTYLITRVLDGNSCRSVDTSIVNVRVNAFPVVDLGNDTTVCFYQKVPLEADTGLTSYSWSGGESTRTVMIDTTGVGIGTKEVYVVVSNNGCESSDTVLITFDGCVGIAESGLNNQLSLYPNPSTGLYYLDLADYESSLSISITDMNGKMVSERSYDSNSNDQKVVIDISDQPAGIYLLKVLSENGVAGLRLVKE